MIPVILSGGSGTRLWPVSRAKFPKQFCDFYDKSFIESTIERLLPLGSPYILTVEALTTLTRKSALSFNIPESHLIFEPFGKNTAPAIALLCHLLSQKGQEQEVVGIFPADHLVLKKDVFLQAVQFGEECAKEGQIVTLGIKPSRAATGYGYIEVDESLFKSHQDKNVEALFVKRFCEKPNAQVAEEFLQSGNHYWNAGMFLFSVQSMMLHFKKFLPDLWSRITTIREDLSNLKHVYANLESISIDYGVMEKLKEQVCIPCDMGWSDVGSWEEIARVGDEVKDLSSKSLATIFSVEGRGNFSYSSNRKVMAFIGVNDLIVVDTPDGLLVSKKGQSEKVKEIVDKMMSLGYREAEEHAFERRPWGQYEVLRDEEDYKLKKIEVAPGQKLSYQSHDQREEHWTVIRGQGEVTLNDEVQSVKRGSQIYISTKMKHRIHNTGSEPLVFIEVQIGSYFGEDDIVRYQDDYNRV